MQQKRLETIKFCFFLAVVEQHLKNAAEGGLFWVAFLVWGLWRLQVACQKVLESEKKCRKVLKKGQKKVKKAIVY